MWAVWFPMEDFVEPDLADGLPRRQLEGPGEEAGAGGGPVDGGIGGVRIRHPDAVEGRDAAAPEPGAEEGVVVGAQAEAAEVLLVAAAAGGVALGHLHNGVVAGDGPGVQEALLGGAGH